MTTVQPMFSTPLRRATVAVVLNSNDHDHFTVSGEAGFRAACPPWADMVFVADHDIDEGLGALLDDGGVDTVLFASNSLITTAARTAVAAESFTRRWAEDGPNGDVGAVVLHQYLDPGAALPVDFLGAAAFSLVGEPPRAVRADDIDVRPDWLFATDLPSADVREAFLRLAQGYGPKRHCLWARTEPRYPLQWQPVAWEKRREPLIAECTAGGRTALVSRAPLDLIGCRELLGSLIAAALRPRGCLLVEKTGTTGSTAFSPSLAVAIERGRFVERHRPSRITDIQLEKPPYDFFAELILTRDWPLEQIQALDEETILRKLERGGSIVATFTGPGAAPVTVRLHGQPPYAQRANHLASWLAPRIDSFKGDVWGTRALAEAVATARAAFRDERLIPHALRQEFVRRHVADPLVRRVHHDNVDDNVLPTAATFAALRALGVPGYEGMVAWLGERLDREPPSVLAQVLLLVPELATPRRRQAVLEAAKQDRPGDDERLLKAYTAVLFADTEPELLLAAATDQSLGLGVRAELLRGLARSSVEATDATVGLAALVRQQVDRLAAGNGGLEAVCLGNAALMELGCHQGIGPGAVVQDRPRELDARTIDNVELVRSRDTAVREAEEFRRRGRQATTLVFAVLVLLTIAAVVAVFVWGQGGFAGKFSLASGVFAVLSGLTGFFVARARKAGLPPWPTG